MNADTLIETLARMSRSDEVQPNDLDDATVTLDTMIGHARTIQNATIDLPNKRWRKPVEQQIVTILKTHGPDGHIDGYAELTDFVVALLRKVSRTKVWILTEERNAGEPSHDGSADKWVLSVHATEDSATAAREDAIAQAERGGNGNAPKVVFGHENEDDEDEGDWQVDFEVTEWKVQL